MTAITPNTGYIEAYFGRCADALLKSDMPSLYKIADAIINARRRAIFTAGNGGSAATASHVCNDLIKGCRIDGRAGFNARCLDDSAAVTTCLANDFSYEDIFSLQLETFAKKGDLLIVFSGSGNSPNIIKAIKTAREMGLMVAGLTGRDGGAMQPLCDVCVVAPIWGMEEIEDIHMAYCHALVGLVRERLRKMWGIEIIRRPRGGFKSALFDFDGTVSLLREGWQQVMIPYFTEVLAAAEQSPDMDEVRRTVTDFVDLLTGKQTIFQCERLAEEVGRRGGAALDPLEYKREYLRRLMERIKSRLEALRKGEAGPEEYLVPGCRKFLEKLKERGLKLYLASGTDEADVLEEARLLGIGGYFNGGIYGALDNIKDCSKEIVIKKILDENNISGGELVSFGDGYVE
ncbi:MAG: SIS domain-containing protein, partial [Defluviitaleaceae bacterium]|nr:SIS domain-containing protein [Defluviitaleaceae bacterium]